MTHIYDIIINHNFIKIKIWFQNRRTKWKREYYSEYELNLHHHYYAMHGVISPPTQVANQTTMIGQNPASVQAQAHQVAALSHRLSSNPFIQIPSAPNLTLHHMTPTALRKWSSLYRT